MTSSEVLNNYAYYVIGVLSAGFVFALSVFFNNFLDWRVQRDVKKFQERLKESQLEQMKEEIARLTEQIDVLNKKVAEYNKAYEQILEILSI